MATQYLQNLGYTIVKRNFRTRFGEVDLIAKKNGEYFFVEVKTRNGDRCGSPTEVLTPQKIRRFEKLAVAYSQKHDLDHNVLHLSLIGIILGGETPRIEFIKDITE